MGGVNSCDAFWIMIAFPLGFGVGSLSMDNLLNWLLLFYTIFFGSLLITFHVRMKGDLLDFLKRNYGFMFSWMGRFAFLLFMATLLFTANEQWWYTIVVGILTVLVAILNCMILCNHPAYQSGGEYAVGEGMSDAGKKTPTSSSSASTWENSDNNVSVNVNDVNTSMSSSSSPFAADDPPVADSKKDSSAAAWDDMDDDASAPSSSTSSSGGTKVVALYKFDADENDPEQISMKADDVLTLISRQADGWAKVVKDGKKGVVPVQYISEA
eukprot:g5210.t1